MAHDTLPLTTNTDYSLRVTSNGRMSLGLALAEGPRDRDYWTTAAPHAKAPCVMPVL